MEMHVFKFTISILILLNSECVLIQIRHNCAKYKIQLRVEFDLCVLKKNFMFRIIKKQLIGLSNLSQCK